jgi:purine-nucleoside phosphorylase
MPGIEDLLNSEGIGFEWLHTGDPILGMAKGNLKLELNGEPYYILFIGRGAIEATDRAWIIGHDSAVKEILFIGAAASLKEDLRPGSCNVPLYTLAVFDPSLIYTGLSEGLPVADRPLVQRVLEIGKRVGCNVTSSLHASAPFFYMETRRFLEYLSGIGVYTIDMELAYILRILNSLKKESRRTSVCRGLPIIWDRIYVRKIRKHQRIDSRYEEGNNPKNYIRIPTI